VKCSSVIRPQVVRLELYELHTAEFSDEGLARSIKIVSEFRLAIMYDEIKTCSIIDCSKLSPA
jgi:hypothetical protein